MSNAPVARFRKLVVKIGCVAALFVPAYAAFAAPTSRRERMDLRCNYIGTGYCCLCWVQYPYYWCESGAIQGVYYCDATTGECGTFACQVQ